MIKQNAFTCLLAISFLLLTFEATAQKVYELNLKKELGIFGTGAALFGGSYLIDQNRSLINIDEITRLDPNNVNSFDRYAISKISDEAAQYSDYFRDYTTLIPIGIAAFGNGRKEFGSVSVIYLETLLINSSLTAITKNIAGRVRPFVYNEDVSIDDKLLRTSKRSFFSGHVSHTASMSFLSAKLLNDLYPDSNLKWLWWTGATSFTVATSILRIEAGKHFPTDVIVGGIVGAGIGILIPELHKVKIKNADLSIFSVSGSLGLSYSLTF